ncbi:Dolichyl-phosphate beta-glucosyltransferase Short=DolP-glucosyltransferase; AltName: Full=Asparagine-linked glycosylation protein 5 [Serendipita indica DSM 11827]|uniref:dolichyl-phosphate beta-glucosyltransferase n=1 Tax=Serendipita indica (strain DSM 11827) TaxID=1109443 RepID=G4T649_SERID|nr:Dolichyl-phosphate beta-glucosyltransferase Short=DolP-glucosyltransferase; AltName: Full=Asparagine-linked glycosylation protein 5 [Serendipita indica DSM 11827]CCA66790.1 related to dolichyl-phosphate beta-glucosyltransferase [Serendipita indica DSM 11827]
MGLLDVRPDDLLPILAIILVVLVIALGDFINFFLPSRAIPAASEYTYVSALNPDEPKPLPSLGDTPSVKLSIVVPAYDETERLKPMIDSTLTHLHSLRPHRSFEILIVDDGSRDGTADLALKLSISHAKTDSKDEIRVVRLETNRGKGGAVKHGFMHARGERILFVDADDATRFSDLETLWSKMDEMEGDEGAPAIVIGSRAHLVNSEAVVKRSKIRNFLMKGFHTILRILGVGHIGDTQCGFKLFNRAAAQQVFPPLHLPTWIFDVEILLVAQALNIPVLEIPVHWKEIPGSKLNIAGASLGMLRDLLLMRANYMLGRWTPYDFRED